MEALADPFRPRSRLNRTPPAATTPKQTPPPSIKPVTVPFPSFESSPVPAATAAKPGTTPTAMAVTPGEGKVATPAKPAEAREPLASVSMNTQSPIRAPSPPVVGAPSPKKAASPMPAAAAVSTAPMAVPPMPSLPSPAQPAPQTPVVQPQLSATPASRRGGFDLRKMAQSLRAPAPQAAITSTPRPLPCSAGPSGCASPVVLVPTPTAGSPANPFVRRPKVARTPPSLSLSGSDDSPSTSSAVVAPPPASTTPAQLRRSSAIAPRAEPTASSEEEEAMDVVPLPAQPSVAVACGRRQEAGVQAMLISPAKTTSSSSSTGPAAAPPLPPPPVVDRSSSSAQTELDLKEVMEVRDRLALQESELKQEVGILRARLSKQRQESERLLSSWTEAHDTLQASEGELRALQEEKAMLAREVTDLKSQLSASSPTEQQQEQDDTAKQLAEEQLQRLRLHELELRVQLSASLHHLDCIGARERQLRVRLLEQEARTHELQQAFSRDYRAICDFGCNVSRKVVGAMSRMETSLDGVHRLLREREEGAGDRARRAAEAEVQRLLHERAQESEQEKEKCLATLNREADDRLAEVTAKADQQVRKYEEVLQGRMQQIEALEKSLEDLRRTTAEATASAVQQTAADTAIDSLEQEVAMMVLSSPPPTPKKKPAAAQPKRRRDRPAPPTATDGLQMGLGGGGKATPFSSPEPKRGRPALPSPQAPPRPQPEAEAAAAVEEEEQVAAIAASEPSAKASKKPAKTDKSQKTKKKAGGRAKKQQEAAEREEEEETAAVESTLQQQSVAARAVMGSQGDAAQPGSHESSAGAMADEADDEPPLDVPGGFDDDDGGDMFVGGNDAMMVSPMKRPTPPPAPKPGKGRKPKQQAAPPASCFMDDEPAATATMAQSPAKPCSLPSPPPPPRSPAPRAPPAMSPHASPALRPPRPPPQSRPRGVAGLPPGPKSLAPAQAKDKIKKLSLFASFKDKAAIPKLKAQPPRPAYSEN